MSAPSESAASIELLPEFVAEGEREFMREPRRVLARNAVTQHNAPTVLLDRDVVTATSHTFSNKVPKEGKVTSQGMSGRCWLFACLNMLRLKLMAKYNLPPEFQLSQSYLFFWDKLEKCNNVLETMIETADEPVDGRLVQFLLADPISDAGQWDMVARLVEKYGVMPRSVFPESACCTNSRFMNGLLANKLRQFALELRNKHHEGASLEELRALKWPMVRELHHVLITFLGQPPKEFDWTCYDKGGKLISMTGLTPLQFYREHVDAAADGLVSLIDDPRNPRMRLYTVDKLRSMAGAPPVRYINLTVDQLRQAVMAQIDAGAAVWFGCDVGKCSYRDLGVMDDKLYDYDTVFGLRPGMSKAERLVMGDSRMAHAMLITGYHREEGRARPTRWRVENSWGEKGGEKGYWIMSDSWFDEYVFQVVVPIAALPADVQRVLEQEPVVLPAWDPMGSLAQ